MLISIRINLDVNMYIQIHIFKDLIGRLYLPCQFIYFKPICHDQISMLLSASILEILSNI